MPEPTRNEWDATLSLYPEANFLQSPLWAETNRLIGHQVVFERINDKTFFVAFIKNARRGRYLELPGGPLVDWHDKNLVEETFKRIVEVAKQHHCVFVRFRPQLEKTSENESMFKNLPRIVKGLDLRPAPMHLHAQNTVILDLNEPEETLLMNMRRQTRYEVRRSEKLGLKIIEDSSEAMFKEFHKVQLETAKRQGFIPPNEKELFAERQSFSPDSIKLYKVETEAREAVAYGLFLIYGQEAEYFEAASTDLNRKLPGAYALLWHAIKEFKKLGIKRFNLWGIAPPGVEHHRYSGVTTFKTGFGGRVVEFIPAHDIVINKMRYKIDEIVENARKKKRNL